MNSSAAGRAGGRGKLPKGRKDRRGAASNRAEAASVDETVATELPARPATAIAAGSLPLAADGSMTVHPAAATMPAAPAPVAVASASALHTCENPAAAAALSICDDAAPAGAAADIAADIAGLAACQAGESRDTVYGTERTAVPIRAAPPTRDPNAPADYGHNANRACGAVCSMRLQYGLLQPVVTTRMRICMRLTSASAFEEANNVKRASSRGEVACFGNTADKFSHC
jgi:hypothetical protein